MTTHTETTAPGAPTLTIDGAVATLQLNRPEVANRLNPDDLALIRRHIRTVNESPALVLRLRSTGKYFCSGFDIGRIGAGAGGSSFPETVDALEDCRPVTIAVIQGGVFGGGTDLALACDFRLGAIGAEMFMPAARLGLHFYGRGMERYVSRLGLDTAKRLFLTAERIGAEEMLRCGFLTELLEPAALEQRVEQLTETIGGLAPLALCGMKKHLNRIARGTLDAQEIARDIAQADASEDLREGTLAHRQKRKPVFRGR